MSLSLENFVCNTVSEQSLLFLPARLKSCSVFWYYTRGLPIRAKKSLISSGPIIPRVQHAAGVRRLVVRGPPAIQFLQTAEAQLGVQRDQHRPTADE